MEKIYSEKIRKILNNKDRLEKELKVKITNRGRELFIDSSGEKEYFAGKVIEALNFGFRFEVAILLKNEDFDFEILNIKDYTRRKDLERIRARIIGRGGKTLKVLHDLTDCFFETDENKVGVIGYPENLKKAEEAIQAIVRGSKQSNVYSFLEKKKVKPVVDLGLKEGN
ncbi:MAG: KH domain-containing protein [Candidatus Pacearchaeota archaeon]